MFFTSPEAARWNADRQAVEFEVKIGEYRGVWSGSRGRYSGEHRPDWSPYAVTSARSRLISRPEGGPMNKFRLAMLCFTALLAGCGGSLRGDASAGPNPGGGFYGAPNIDIGRINP